MCIEGIVFMSKFNGILRYALKTRRGPADMISWVGIKESFDDYNETREAELQTEKERKQNDADARATAANAETASLTGAAEEVDSVRFGTTPYLGILDDAGQMVTAPESAVKQQFKSHAKRMVRQCVKAIPLSSSDVVNKNNITESSVNNIVGDGLKKCFGIFYVSGNAGESITAPHVRPPPSAGQGAFVKVQLGCCGIK